MRRRRRPHEDSPGWRRGSRPAPDLPDSRALERLLLPASTGQADPHSPQGRAEELLVQAFEEDDPQRQTELASQALSLWPDCADAYVLLADYCGSRKEALALYQKGVEAGQRAIGPLAFREAAGHFWGILATRPYMRAKLGLADSLWTSGRREEAIRHLQEMLVLNPSDNQGIRYMLAEFLLFLDRDEDLARLLAQFPEDSARWVYTKALLAFRQRGDTPEARLLLKTAREANRYIPDYLLDRKYPPAEQPSFYTAGDDNEARLYIAGFMAAWKATPGAIAWLRGTDEQTPKPTPRGPLGFIKNWLQRKLPQQDEVWQVDCRRVTNAIRIGGDKVRPWLGLVVSHSTDLILSHAMLDEKPVAASLWDMLVRAMQNPLIGEPHRPTAIQVRADEQWESLRPHIEEIGIRLVVGELEHLDKVFEEVSEHVAGKPQPSLLDMPNMKPEQVAGFYEAAASFFQQAPWKKVGYEAAIRVECEKYHSGPWYAVLMGQSGLAIGLAVYEDLEAIRRTWERPAKEEENIRQSVATSLIFGEEIDIPLAEVEAAERTGWVVARPDAWPWVMHKERGLSHRPPLAWELELLEGCLRAIPEFVQRRGQDDPAKEEFCVPMVSGELKLVLSWVVE